MNEQAIKKFKDTEQYAYYLFGEAYYRGKNTAIMEREKKMYIEGYGTAVNPFQANHKLASGFFTKIVDQKVNYLLGNGIVFEDEALQESKDDYVKYKFDDFMVELATTSSKKAVGWVYLYVDANQLKMVEVPPEQIAYEHDSKGELKTLWRCYELDGKEVVEEWTAEGVETHVKKGQKWESSGLKAHYYVNKTAVGNVIEQEPVNFGRIPFIPLWNEPDKLSDLARIKGFIDIYDITNSDFANNIDDMQDAFFTIKNYNGAGLEDFLKQLKALKAIPVGEDGEVNAQQLQIPVEARSVFLDLTEKSIFKFSMSVDTTQLSGSSLTNVAIEAQFTDLDLKADKFETQISRFMTELVDFINMYQGTSYDSEFTLDRSMIVNRNELMTTLKEQRGTVSHKTILANHPLVDDVDEEVNLVEEEAQAMALLVDSFEGEDE